MEILFGSIMYGYVSDDFFQYYILLFLK